MSLDLFFGAAAFLFGLAFGSFLNVCIHRLPRGESVVLPASACPRCHHAIRPYDNIPVLSWLLLRGRCRDCKTPISPRYAVVELLTALLFLLCSIAFGPNNVAPLLDQLPSLMLTLKYCIFCFFILGLIFTDAEHQLLPDALTLPGLAIGLLFSLFLPVDNTFVAQLGHWMGIAFPSWRLASLVESAVAAAFGSSFIYGIGSLYLRTRPDLIAKSREAMGFGDVKLMALLGSFLGLRLTIVTLFLGSLIGTAVGGVTILQAWRIRKAKLTARGRAPREASRRAWRTAKIVLRYYQLPFGVFLGIGGIVAALIGNPLLHWYLGLYR